MGVRGRGGASGAPGRGGGLPFQHMHSCLRCWLVEVKIQSRMTNSDGTLVEIFCLTISSCSGTGSKGLRCVLFLLWEQDSDSC